MSTELYSAGHRRGVVGREGIERVPDFHAVHAEVIAELPGIAIARMVDREMQALPMHGLGNVGAGRGVAAIAQRIHRQMVETVRAEEIGVPARRGVLDAVEHQHRIGAIGRIVPGGQHAVDVIVVVGDHEITHAARLGLFDQRGHRIVGGIRAVVGVQVQVATEPDPGARAGDAARRLMSAGAAPERAPRPVTSPS